MRKYIYLGPFAPSLLFSSSISCIICPIYSQYSGYYLPLFLLSFTHSIVGRNISCHCMSRPSTIYNPLPVPTPPIDHAAHLNNYYLLRSFQKNWSFDSLVHLSVPRHTVRVVRPAYWYLGLERIEWFGWLDGRDGTIEVVDEFVQEGDKEGSRDVEGIS